MPIWIEMPKLSDTMTEGTLLRWTVAEGDNISSGDVLAEVETDKATMEMEAFDDGVLKKLYIADGDKAPVGGVIALVLEDGEDAPDGWETAPVREVAEPEEEKTSSSFSAAPAGRPASADGQSAAAMGVKASPLARKVADSLGVDITTVEGSGPGGRVTKKDVERASRGVVTSIKSSGAAVASAGAVSSLPTIRPEVGEGDERIEVGGMRKVIAERLLASKTQIPHFYLQIEVDAQPCFDVLKQINDPDAPKEDTNKYTVNDLILKASAVAAADVPEVNAAWDGDAIVQFKNVDVSVAVAVEGGLVTPVIREAQNKTVLEISKEVKELAGKARDKKLSPAEMAGGTFTVSNLGAYKIEQFSAIINPPQAMILAIGTAKNVPVVNEAGELAVGKRMWIGLSGDHRVVDGAVGATYLKRLRELLEQPTLMLV